MRILGIDPGFAITGYSVIDYEGNKFKLITSGAIETKAGVSFPLRLTKIYDDMQMLVKEYKPDAISVEELFFNNNIKTGINVVGYGRAEKKQVQKMVQSILRVEKVPKLDDITDSMAIAICHAHSSKFAEKL